MRDLIDQLTTPLRRFALRRKVRAGVVGQSDEGRILRTLVDQEDAPRTFVEFGFHPGEFNCASLLPDHHGLLIDGHGGRVADARAIYPGHIRAEQAFLTLDNLDVVRRAFPKLGVLSIDVDGNDYWFMQALIDLQPAVIVVEYNASFGLNSITVPYDPAFERHAKHASGWYHGASLTALTILATRHGYGLAAVSQAGGNAFYTRTGTLDPADAWRPSLLRDRWSNSDATAQFTAIAGQPFVHVLSGDESPS